MHLSSARSKSIYPLLIIERTAAAAPSTPAWVGQIIAAVVAAAMVFVGWLVVERFARRREHRSDLRIAVTSLSAAVDEVQVAATAFYGLAGTDSQALSLAATIKVKIGALHDQLAILKTAGLDIDTDELLKRFRQSVTGGDFDSPARQPLPSTSPAFIKMSGDAQALNRAVQLAMLKRLLEEQPRWLGLR